MNCFLIQSLETVVSVIPHGLKETFNVTKTHKDRIISINNKKSMHISDMLIFLNAVLIKSVPVDTQKTAKDSINTGFVIKSCKE